MPSRLILLAAFLSSILLHSSSLTSVSVADTTGEDFDEDIRFLQEQDDDVSSTPSSTSHIFDPDKSNDDDDEEEHDADFGSFSDYGEWEQQLENDAASSQQPEIDEKDVVVLKERNFRDVIENNRFVMVEFYAPWCGHCQALAPEYAAAATELKAEEVVLAKIDATEENELAHEYDVQGYPTVLFFVDGEHKPFNGLRTKEGIVTWIRKKIGPGVYNITSTEDAERVLTSESRVVMAYLDSLVGSESEELAAASRLDDDISFYQTVDPNVAKLFDIDAEAKRPALVLLKKTNQKISYFDGQFAKSAISEFVFANKLPLVTIFTQETASSIFESPVQKQVLLFSTSKDAEKLIQIFEEAAKFFKGKLIFVFVQIDDEETGKPVADYFGITGDSPQVLAYSVIDDGRKYVLDGDVTLDSVKAFATDFVEDKLKPYYKSDPVPETNDGDVKIVVGNNFDEIVLDESKDVLLEIYAPWCGHCQALEPTYNKLAKHLRGVESLVIGKMDGTTNEHPRAKADGFPTLLFFPAGNKSSEPITVDTDRTVVAFYKFLKEHASIPFKLLKPTTTTKPQGTDPVPSSESSTAKDVKDEL
ncbi:Protein disulfide isomerase-like 1-4 [Dionaea muscipula]